MIDAADAPLVAGFSWYAVVKEGKPYATRKIVRGDGARTSEEMHQAILDRGGAEMRDHIDGDTLNNRRSNLRPATRSQNCANRPKDRDNRTGFKGITRTKQGRFRAVIQRTRGLGTFATAIEAAEAYDTAARETFGAFACVNFPREGERQA